MTMPMPPGLPTMADLEARRGEEVAPGAGFTVGDMLDTWREMTTGTPEQVARNLGLKPGARVTMVRSK